MAVKTPMALYGKLVRPLQAGDSVNSSLDFTDRASLELLSRALTSSDYGKTVVVPADRAVTFTDAGDTVGLNAHGIPNGTTVYFTSIVTTTGIVINTAYYVVGAAANTFQVSATLGGGPLALTTNGTGTMTYPLNVSFNLPTASGLLGKWYRFINNSANLLIVRAGIANKLTGATPTYTGNITSQSNSIDANIATKMSITAAGSTAKYVMLAAQKISLVRMYCVAADTPVLSGIDGRIQDAGGATGVVGFVPGGITDTFAYAADKYIEWPIYGGPATTKEIYFPTLPNGKAIYEFEAYSETINDEFPFMLVPQGCELFIYSDNNVWRSNRTLWDLPENRVCGNLATAGATFANRTELAFHLKGNVDYHIECDIQYSAPVVTYGVVGSLSTGGTPSAISYTVKVPLTATTTYQNHQIGKAVGTAAATSIVGKFNLKLSGNVRLPEDGIVYYADKTENAAANIPIISGSGFAVPVNLKK